MSPFFENLSVIVTHSYFLIASACSLIVKLLHEDALVTKGMPEHNSHLITYPLYRRTALLIFLAPTSEFSNNTELSLQAFTKWVCACKSSHVFISKYSSYTKKSESMREWHWGKGSPALGQVDELHKLLRPLRAGYFNDLYRLIMCRVCRFQLSPFK